MLNNKGGLLEPVAIIQTMELAKFVSGIPESSCYFELGFFHNRKTRPADGSHLFET